VFETLTVREEGAVLFAQIAAPPMTRGGERDLGRVLNDLVDA
jgi:hypothetical protein